MIEKDLPEIILCDVKLPDGNGVDFVSELKKKYPQIEVILLTAYGNIADGVQAMKNGAFDYITKGDDNEKIIPLREAVRCLTSLPATNLKLKDRGLIKPRYFADVVIFDPAKIQDHATFDSPQQYATGVRDVFVNGVQVLKDGEHTGAKPGRVVRRGE
jgi:N-acyl-D-aspartate/D-glutamate deacylase